MLAMEDPVGGPSDNRTEVAIFILVFIILVNRFALVNEILII